MVLLEMRARGEKQEVSCDNNSLFYDFLHDQIVCDIADGTAYLPMLTDLRTMKPKRQRPTTMVGLGV